MNTKRTLFAPFTVAALVVPALIGGIALTSARAADTPVAQDKSHKVSSSKGANPNIKSKRALNVKGSPAPAPSGKANAEVTPAGEVTATKGANPNIKTRRAPNDATRIAKAPVEKGGAATKGAYGSVSVDNWTGYYIDIYMDGDYIGTVSPWGEASGTFPTGTHTLYAYAEFSDGSSLEWGPRTVRVTSGGYTWKLTP